MALSALVLTGCEKVQPNSEPETTLLTVQTERADKRKMSPKATYVSIWDASNNDLVYDLNDFSIFDKITNKDGLEVKPITIESMSFNETASGVVSNYLFAVINLDKALYYDKESKSGKLLVKIETDFGFSTIRPKVSCTEVYWEREKSSVIEKVFRDSDVEILRFYEKW